MPKVERSCLECGGRFETEARYIKRGRGKYCCYACRHRAANRNRWQEHQRAPSKWFWNRVDKSGGARACWPWTGRRLPSGYGRLVLRGRHIGAHRLAYELDSGHTAGDLFVCHHCDNPPCCNPSHLFLGTHQDNMDDMIAKGRKPSGDRHWAALRARSELPERED